MNKLDRRNMVEKLKDKLERQNLLEKLMDKEIERLRKLCFKYKRRDFLNNKVEIIEGSLDKGVAGVYETINTKNKYRYTHRITISSNIIDSYVNYKYDRYDFGKRWYKQRLIEVIRHELVHAFVKDEFEIWADEITDVHSDASPFFLSILYFVGGTSNHHCGIYFWKTKMYEDIKNIKSFTELNLYLSKLLMKYEKEARKLKIVIVKEDNGKVIKHYTNSFKFASGKLGFNGMIRLEDVIVVKNMKNYAIGNLFEIGAMVMPENLKALVDKKNINESFDKKEYTKHIVLNATTMMNIKTGEKSQIPMAI